MTAPFTGGRPLMLASAGVGAAGIGLTAAGFTQHPVLAASSWLLAFTYWTGLAMASLLLVAIFNVAGARWITLLRRQLEHHAGALWVCAAAFAGVAATVKQLYVWASPSLVLPRGRRLWLNESGFVMRGALVFVVFIAVWLLLDRSSRLQETRAPDEVLKGQARSVSAGALFFLALAMTAGAVDWLMSLEPAWFSAAFGVYWFAGSFVSAIALLLLTAIVPTDPNLPAAKASDPHLAGLATLLFAASCFWAFLAYSQYLVIWQANLPEEVSWLFARGLFSLARFHHGAPATLTSIQWSPSGTAWFPVTVLLILGRFVLPSAALLSYAVKRHRTFLTALCVWILTMQFVDLFWIIKPSLRLHSDELALPEATFSWTDLAAWGGLGGACLGFVLFRMRGRYAIPANDPELGYSERYRQPMA
jgi:hypothetical protein